MQARRLRAILVRNQDCEYGRSHGFAAIADPAAFAQRVPVVRYDALRGAIDRMADGERGVLVSDPVVAFEETGGSSGGAKLVPYTEAALASFRRGLLPWLDDLYTGVRGLDDGRAYWSISPAARAPRITAGEIAVGLPSDAAYLGEDVATELLATLCVPPAAARLRDIDAWRRFTLIHLLAAADLALVSIWSPTFLQELLRLRRTTPSWLCRCIVDGDPGVDATAAGAALPRPRADRARGELVRVVLLEREPEWARLWPRLAVISCWDQAAARPYAAALRRAFPGVRVQGKGLLATEGIGTIPLRRRGDAGAGRRLRITSSSSMRTASCARSRTDVTPARSTASLITTASGLLPVCDRRPCPRRRFRRRYADAGVRRPRGASRATSAAKS